MGGVLGLDSGKKVSAMYGLKAHRKPDWLRAGSVKPGHVPADTQTEPGNPKRAIQIPRICERKLMKIIKRME